MFDSGIILSGHCIQRIVSLAVDSIQEKSVQYFSSLSEEKTPQLMIDLSQLLTSASIITKLPPYAQPETETFLRVQGKKKVNGYVPNSGRILSSC